MSNDGTATKISEAEWRVMEVLWEGGELAPAQIIKRLETTTDWNHRTIRSLLSRLVAKGVVSHSKETGANLYRTELSREECVRQETESFVKRVFCGDSSPANAGANAMGQVIESFFGGSVEEALAAHLGRGEKLDPEELEGLSALIEEAKEQRKLKPAMTITTLESILLDSALRGSLLLAAASLVTLAMKKQSAARRHLVWIVALIAMLVAPLVSAALPSWKILPASTSPNMVAPAPKDADIASFRWKPWQRRRTFPNWTPPLRVRRCRSGSVSGWAAQACSGCAC